MPVALCAPDKLRGALDAHEAAAALAAGARAAGWEAIEHPLADGGEGTCDAIVRGRGGERVSVRTRDALGRPRTATLGVLPDGTCIVEGAEAIGLMHSRATAAIHCGPRAPGSHRWCWPRSTGAPRGS